MSLHSLVWANNLEALKKLLGSGAEPNGADSESGWTPLHKALYLGHVRCAVLLLEHGARVDVKDPRGLTPLDLVSREILATRKHKHWDTSCGEEVQVEIAGAAVNVPEARTEVYTWGNGANYQLGTGTADLISLPRRVVSLSSIQVKKLAASKFHTVALSCGNEVYTWGWGRGGRLGHEELSAGNKDAAQIYPRLVKGLKGKSVTDIAAAKHHTLAVTATGEVYSWGSNKDGKLGYHSIDTQPVPRKVIALKGVVAEAVSAANRHSVVLVSGGLVYTWGANRYAQLGYGTSDSISNPTPRCVESVQNKVVCGISTSKRHTLVVTKDGEVFSWGYTFVNPTKLGFRLHRLNYQTSSGEEIRFHHGYEDVYRPFVIKVAAGVGQSSCITRRGEVLVWNSAAQDLEAVPVRGSLCGKNGISIGAGKRLMAAVGAMGEIHTWEASSVNSRDAKSTVVYPEAKRICNTIRATDVWVGEKHVVALQHWQPSYELTESPEPEKVQKSSNSSVSSDPITGADQVLDDNHDSGAVDKLSDSSELPVSPKQAPMRLQDLCERVAARHVVDPRNAVQLLMYSDSVGAACLRRHSLQVAVLNLDLVFAEGSKHLLETPPHLLFEIEKNYQATVLGIDESADVSSWWLKDLGHQLDMLAMGRRPTLLRSVGHDEEYFTEGSSRFLVGSSCTSKAGLSNDNRKPGFMVDKMAPVLEMKAKLERNIKKKLQQIASLEMKASQGQFLDSQQLLKLARKDVLENGLRHLRTGSDVSTVQNLIAGTSPGFSSKAIEIRREMGSYGSDLRGLGSGDQCEIAISKQGKKKKKAATIKLNKPNSCPSEKADPSDESEEVSCSVGFSVTADSASHSKQTARPARTKAKKGGLSAFLSGQLERSDITTETTKALESPTWMHLSMPSERPTLKDIMQQEQPTTKKPARYAQHDKPFSAPRVSLDDFMPRPAKPKKLGPAWGGLGTTPPATETPSIQGIQIEQERRRRGRSNQGNFSLGSSQGHITKNRWYIPEEPEVEDLRSIQDQEYLFSEMKRGHLESHKSSATPKPTEDNRSS